MAQTVVHEVAVPRGDRCVDEKRTFCIFLTTTGYCRRYDLWPGISRGFFEKTVPCVQDMPRGAHIVVD